MRTRISGRVCVWIGMAVLLACAWPAPAAQADPDCYGGYGRVRGGFGGHVRSGSCDCAIRRPCSYEHRHAYRFHARGQGWALLRRHMVRLRIAPTHSHPRSYFFRRWPCWRNSGPLQWGGRTCIGHDFPATECPLVASALDDAESGAESPTRPERMLRAMERFYRGAWDGAAADFEKAASEDEKDARPLWGLALCRIMRHQWSDAVEAMSRLVDLNAFDVSDRLDLEGSWDEPDRLTDLRRALVDLTRWSFHEVDAQIVAAWVHAATGDTKAARRHVRAALRFAPDHAVARHLKEGLAGKPPPKPASPPESRKETMPRESPAPPPSAPRRTAL